ncbi:hypothetical protein [Taibaiella koreensis]|uniref:hypothetical protein n=1 Tax=Taibaiella koreensis TaxID=1268548 RepID=UPI000E59CC51|nr:hypothetical protein [Taibaiella koreensis]
MDKDKKIPEEIEHKEDETRRYNKEYPENGDNNSAGKEESGSLPNRPAENAEQKAPEEDKE